MKNFKKFNYKSKPVNPIKKALKSIITFVSFFISGIVVGLCLLYFGVFNTPATYIARFSNFSEVKKTNLEFGAVIVEKDTYIKGKLK